MTISTATAATVARNLRDIERLATAAPQMLDVSAQSLAAWVGRAAALLEAKPAPVRVVLDMSGGALQGASIDGGALDLLVVDYDTGHDDMRPVPQADGGTVDAETTTLGAYLVQPAWVAAMFANHEAAHADDGCPKGDPDCLGNNGDCHDACSTFADRAAAHAEPAEGAAGGGWFAVRYGPAGHVAGTIMAERHDSYDAAQEAADAHQRKWASSGYWTCVQEMNADGTPVGGVR